MNTRTNSFLLFLIGLFSVTDIYMGGYIGISELFMFLAAPIILLQDYVVLKRDGFGSFLTIVGFTMLGCVVASIVNHTPFPSFSRGFSAVYSIFACTVCLHRFLRKDFSGLRWLLLGFCLSQIVNVFIFQQGASRRGDTSIISEVGMENTVGYVLFWSERIKNFIYLPIEGWYSKIPYWCAVPMSFVVVILGLFFSGGSGRSLALASLCTTAMLIIGSTQRRRLEFIRRYIVIFGCLGILLLLAFKGVYRQLASSGQLGDAALGKYERQTQRGTDFLSLLMGGRVEFFVGLFSCLRHPVIGYGPWAIDYDGMYGEFLSRYGLSGDYEHYLRMTQRLGTGYVRIIPAHSYIVCFWLWYGIFGLILWAYVLYLILRTMTKWLSLYPPWYGYLACALPIYVWNILFSPFGSRIINTLPIVVCLLLRAVAWNRLPAGGVANPNFDVYSRT